MKINRRKFVKQGHKAQVRKAHSASLRFQTQQVKDEQIYIKSFLITLNPALHQVLFHQNVVKSFQQMNSVTTVTSYGSEKPLPPETFSFRAEDHTRA